MSTDDTSGWCAPPETVHDLETPEYLGFGNTPTLAQYARMAEPIVFPAPRDPSIQDRIEATAEQIQVGFPYRTLLDCRQLAARLVDEVMCWDALWPEAEGDCGCSVPGMPEGWHLADCVWAGEGRSL